MSTTTQSPQAGSKLPSEHDGFAIASLVTAFFLPILGIIFGHLSNHRAKLAHRAKSGLAVAGLVLGYLFTVISVLVISIVAAASSTPAASMTPAPPARSAPSNIANPDPVSAAPSSPPTITPRPPIRSRHLRRRTPRLPPGPRRLMSRLPLPIPAAAPSTCHLRDNGQLPDPGCTPGATDSRVTQATIYSTICVRGYTATVRPRSSVTSHFKYSVSYPEYGVPASARGELDHLIPLELGGSSAAAHLWPEIGPLPNPKDSVENALNHAVCSGRVSLRAAQRAIAADWLTAESVLAVASAPAPYRAAAPPPPPARGLPARDGSRWPLPGRRVLLGPRLAHDRQPWPPAHLRVQERLALGALKTPGPCRGGVGTGPDSTRRNPTERSKTVRPSAPPRDPRPHRGDLAGPQETRVRLHARIAPIRSLVPGWPCGERAVELGGPECGEHRRLRVGPV